VTGAVQRLRDLRAVLESTGFRRLVSVRLVGQFSDGLLQAALATFVLFSPERQPDALKVATAFTILLLPYSLIGPFAGVLLDRWRRRNVLVVANWLKAGFVLPVLALVAAGNDGLFLGVAVLIVLGIGRFVLAGLSASLPHVVDGKTLVTANAIAPTAGTMMAALGAITGVALRAGLGGDDRGSLMILALAATGFLLAGLLALRMRANQLGPDGRRPGDSPRAIATGMVDGIRTLIGAPTAGRAVLVVGIHRIAFGVLTVGALLFVRNALHPPSAADAALNDFALITGAAALGGLLGAISTPAAARRLGPVPWSSLALAQAGLIGIGLVLLGTQLPELPWVLLGAISVGFAGQSVKVCSDALVQQHIADDHLGRVFAIFDMFVNVCLVSGISLMAFTAPSSGQAPVLYAITGIGLVLAASWYFRVSGPSMRTVTREGPR